MQHPCGPTLPLASQPAARPLSAAALQASMPMAVFTVGCLFGTEHFSTGVALGVAGQLLSLMQQLAVA